MRWPSRFALRSLPRLLFSSAGVLLELFSPAKSFGRPTVGEDGASRAACEVNLRLIYDALQEYRARRGDWPPNLTQLLSEFLADPNTLICPVDRQNWTVRTWRHQGIVDPGFDPRSSYTSVHGTFLDDVYWRGLPRITARQWKQRQSIFRQAGRHGSYCPLP